MAANRINSLQNLVLMWRLPTHAIAIPLLNLCNACCKCEKILGAVIPAALVGKNGDKES